MMTRLFDIILSGLLILLSLPFVIPVMVMLKLTGEHDVFYRQTRVGRYARDFGLLKFATMLRNSPALPGGLYTQKNDPRMLPLGGWLRKTKINELPQLLNILGGDMSLVGYRPTVREHYAAYPAAARERLFHYRPGLTGLGSIVFRNEEEMLHEIKDKDYFHNKIIVPYKAELECWYIEHGCLGIYFALIFLTALVIVFPNQALWKKFKGLPPVPPELASYI